MSENKNNGIKTALAVLLALIMTTTIFVPVIGVAQNENTSTENTNEGVNEANSNLPDVPEDNPDGAPLLPGMEGYQEPAPPEIEIPEEPEIPEMDISDDYGVVGLEEESASTVYIDTPDYVIKNGNVVNNTTVSEAQENPDIILSDVGAYPLEMPELTDTHLSGKDLTHWRDLFPKFMAFEDKDNVVYVELKNVGNI